MPNIYNPETWGNLPQEVISKLIVIREMMTKENEREETISEIDWETEF